MLRVRFKVPFLPADMPQDNTHDYRPVIWPVPHPYWCSGESSTASILVAYADSEEYIFKYWPDAIDLDIMDSDTTIRFTDRFPKPDWYKQ